MAALSFTREEISNFTSIINTASRNEYVAELEKWNLTERYASDMGRLMLTAELREPAFVEPNLLRYDFDEICTRGRDLRCQVGQVLAHLARQNLPGYSPFFNNASATVLIVDRRGLDLPAKPFSGEFPIKSLECRHGLSLTNYGAPADALLCDSAFYANEHIPDTRIFGSGYFFDHDKIVTAAHVLDKIKEQKLNKEDVLFIRAHYSRGKEESSSIQVSFDDLYAVDQPQIMDNDQTIYGEGGDIAWLRVKNYYPVFHPRKVYSGRLNSVYPGPVEPGMPVYGLGHGLGLPMKLSFGGKIGVVQQNPPGDFHCDINILPGSSGSPIFHAETHQLLGVVSGLHEIYTDFKKGNHCVFLKINMEGALSGVATQVGPLFKNI